MIIKDFENNYDMLIGVDNSSRFFMARATLLELFSFLHSNTSSPVERMRLLDEFVFAPLLADGPVNELEIEFVNRVLNQNFNTEDVKAHTNGIDLAKAQKDIMDIMEKLPNSLLLNVTYLMMIGILSDSGDTYNDKEAEFFNPINLKFIELF